MASPQRKAFNAYGVMRGLDPRIHPYSQEFFRRGWIAGSSPAMTTVTFRDGGQIALARAGKARQQYRPKARSGTFGAGSNGFVGDHEACRYVTSRLRSPRFRWSAS